MPGIAATDPAERRREANESYYAGLRQRYRVEITPGALGNGASE